MNASRRMPSRLPTLPLRNALLQVYSTVSEMHLLCWLNVFNIQENANIITVTFDTVIQSSATVVAVGVYVEKKVQALYTLYSASSRHRIRIGKKNHRNLALVLFH